MKAPRLTALFASLALAGTAVSQDASKLDEPTLKLDKAAAESGSQVALDPPARLPESVRNMPEDERRKLGGLLEDAVTYLGGLRVQEAFEKLIQAEAMVEDYAPVHNLKGAAYTKLRDFEKAEASFMRAVELDPSAFISRFNLTEIYFVSGKFESSNATYKKMLRNHPDMPESTRALIRFKMLVGYLMQDDVASAEEILDTFNFFDDHPGFYFGKAAMHYHADEEDEAKSWIVSANKIYPKNQIVIYTDSFVEVGWIENLQ